MKSRTLKCIIAMTLFAAMAIPVEVRLAAQEEQKESGITIAANPVPVINEPLVPDAAKPGGVVTGMRTAALNVSDNGGGSPQSVSLSGSDVAGICSRFGYVCGRGHPPCCAGLHCVFTGGPFYRYVCE